MLRILRILTLVALMLAAVGCNVNDDLTPCPRGGIVLEFDYILHHKDGGDRFDLEVDGMTIYIYDDRGMFIESLSPEDYGPGNSIDLSSRLEGGKSYTLLAWGGDMSAYTVTVGDKLADFRLALKEGTAGVATPPTPLFYGEKQVTAPTDGNPLKVVISLIKDTSVIKFRITDVTDEASAPDSRAGEGLYEIYCEGRNTILNSENKIAENAPQMKYMSGEGSLRSMVYEAEVDMFRLQIGDQSLMVRVKDILSGEDILLSNLVELIRQIPPHDGRNYQTQHGMDEEDEFLIELEVDRGGDDGLHVVIKVNGWIVNPVLPGLL